MLQHAYLLAKTGADTAENEQHFAENLPKISNYPTGRLRGAEDCSRRRAMPQKAAVHMHMAPQVPTWPRGLRVID